MPPRRSARAPASITKPAASSNPAKPTTKTAATKLATTKPATTKKRTRSPARDRPQPVKRQKAERAPYFNSLPTASEHVRPGLQLFVWGSGGCGQLGLGPDVKDDLEKPRRHMWAQEQMEGGAFGDAEGAGLEDIAAGGMHTLLLDEKGTVSPVVYTMCNMILIPFFRSDMVLWCE